MIQVEFVLRIYVYLSSLVIAGKIFWPPKLRCAYSLFFLFFTLFPFISNTKRAWETESEFTRKYVASFFTKESLYFSRYFGESCELELDTGCKSSSLCFSPIPLGCAFSRVDVETFLHSWLAGVVRAVRCDTSLLIKIYLPRERECLWLGREGRQRVCVQQ